MFSGVFKNRDLFIFFYVLKKCHGNITMADLIKISNGGKK
jgi:hypothetical protein